jgi:hemolysin D
MFWIKEDHHEFKPLLIEIEDEPLNPLGRLVFWVILLVFLFFALWLFFGQIDVVVTARGKVVPAGEVKTIQPLTHGVVSAILVESGQLVAAGEVLMEIDPVDTEPELASLKAGLQQIELEMARIGALLAGTKFAPDTAQYDAVEVQVQTRLYQSDRDKSARQTQIKREQLSQIDERLATEQKNSEQLRQLLLISQQRQERLEPVRDLISRDDYDRSRTDVVAYDNQLSAALHKMEELRASRQQVEEELQLLKAEERNRLLAELAAKRQDFLTQQARIERTAFINARQQIRSPVRGYVTSLLVHTVGGVVTPAETLAIVVPADVPPLIKAQILNKDIGYLAPGMATAIKVDTFEFQKYGMLDGRLLQVAQDSIEDEHLGPVYEAYIEPLETTLMVDGVAMPLTTGMAVSAELKVGKRRMIEFFIYPLIKYWDEGTSVR